MLTQCFLPDFPSLRSKRFCLVSEQKKTEERDFRFWPRGAIFRAVFDSCSSLLAPKPHRNACYAGYDFPQYNSTMAFSLVASRTNNVKQKKTFSRGQGRIFQRYAQFSKYLSRTPPPPPNYNKVFVLHKFSLPLPTNVFPTFSPNRLVHQQITRQGH